MPCHAARISSFRKTSLHFSLVWWPTLFFNEFTSFARLCQTLTKIRAKYQTKSQKLPAQHSVVSLQGFESSDQQFLIFPHLKMTKRRQKHNPSHISLHYCSVCEHWVIISPIVHVSAAAFIHISNHTVGQLTVSAQPKYRRFCAVRGNQSWGVGVNHCLTARRFHTLQITT